MARPRLLIADDHPLILEGLLRLLTEAYDIVGSAADGRALIEAADRLQPDLIVLDIALPLMNGIEAARRIRSDNPGARLVFVTQYTDRHYVQEAFRAGASGYVVKQSASSELAAAITEALRGRYYISESLKQGLPAALLGGKTNPAELFGGALTPRQREVLQLLAEGRSAKEIAEILRISHKTVEFHKACIMDELGLRTTAELTRYAIANGIVQM
jgi:DNA-binding NarL/FixJ family response regulator